MEKETCQNLYPVEIAPREEERKKREIGHGSSAKGHVTVRESLWTTEEIK